MIALARWGITGLSGKDEIEGEDLGVDEAAALGVAVERVGGAEEGPRCCRQVADQLGRGPRGEQQGKTDHRSSYGTANICAIFFLIFSTHSYQMLHRHVFFLFQGTNP